MTHAKLTAGLLSIFLLVIACEGGHFKSSAASDNIPVSEPSSENQVAQDPPSGETPTITDPVAKAPIDDGLIFKDCNGNVDLPFVADLYQLVPDTQQLPDFANLKPIKQICIRQLNIANRDFKEGFPGVEGLIEWFALSIKV